MQHPMVEAQSPAAWLAIQAGRFPGNDLLVLPRDVAALWGMARTVWTYREVEAEVEALAARYRAAGYGAGHRVALLLENRPQHYLHWLALNRIGVAIVPVNPDYTADELAYLLDHSEAALVVALHSRHDQVRPVADALGIAVAAEDDAPPPAPRPAGAPPADPG